MRASRPERSTDPSDYPAGKAPYARRSLEALVDRAKELGQHVGIYAERLLAGPLPWTRMRQAYALLRLCDRYGLQRVEAVCARAIAFDVIDVPRVERMLKAARNAEDAAQSGGRVVTLPQSRFARDPSSFATRRKGGE